MPSLSIPLKARLLFLVALLFCQLLFFSVVFDAYSQQLAESDRWYAFLAYFGKLAKAFVAVFAIFLLVVWHRRAVLFGELKDLLSGYRFLPFLWCQLVTYIPFLFCSGAVFGDYFPASSIPSVVVLAWFFLLFLLCLFWGLAFAPLNYWRSLLVRERLPLCFGLIAGLLAWGVAQYSQSLWGPLGELTFNVSAFLLNIFHSEIYIDSNQRLLGAGSFVVEIADQCSGYEGIGLVVIFTSFYLVMFKKEFRFPQALLLFPIGILSIWIFNVFRIVALIAIGDSISEDVAVGGFHSQAGWIAFLIVISGLLITAHRVPFFCSQDSSAKFQGFGLNLPVALLVPFVVLMASIILTSAFSADFMWLYPIRVIAVLIALVICWKVYSFSEFKIRLEPILIGILVFIVWVLIVPNDPEQNQITEDILAATPMGVMIFWLVFRFVGAVITVPLVEELMFRGYLLSKVSSLPVAIEGKMSFSWKGLALSSILFGILHGSSLAGVFAGFMYGLVRYRSNTVLDAVVAHSVTNLLLSIVVLSTGAWSLW